MISIKTKILFGVLIFGTSLVYFASFSDDSAFAEVTNHDPRTAQIPQLEIFQGGKSFVVRLHFDSRTEVTLESVKAGFGLAHTHIGDPPLLRALISSDTNQILYRFNSWHPLWASYHSPDGAHSVKILDSASGSFIFGYNPDYAAFRLYDVPLNQELICVNLKPAIREFCIENLQQCGSTDIDLGSSVSSGFSVSGPSSIPAPSSDYKITQDDDDDPCPKDEPEYKRASTTSTEEKKILFRIPSWIKQNAGWWADGQIKDDSFVEGIKYLIKEDIMRIPETKAGTGTSQEIPSWIKQNADWWSQGQITDESFVNGVQWLIKNGIMKIG